VVIEIQDIQSSAADDSHSNEANYNDGEVQDPSTDNR
jgi:hypothetical protein